MLVESVIASKLAENLASHAVKSVTVNVDNYVKAETAFQFDRFLNMTGGINKWCHNRQATPLDKQNVVKEKEHENIT
jgi:hypothetical protein